MSIASTAPPGVRRRFMSGVALIALIAGVSIAGARLYARLAPVTLASLESSAPARAPVPAPRVAAQLAPSSPRAYVAPRMEPNGAPDAGWVRVMAAPEMRVQRVAPAQYAVVKERVLIEPERRVERADGAVVEIVPARYGVRERRVETRPAHMVEEIIPATWEWRPRPAVAAGPSG
ncbi:MAG: hypothetical protein HZY79_15460 [Rhodoblastus sp.]|nr:MAG: hypothetical protein HZY79_15460 [Rhodoblastus sp.]